MIHSIVWAMTSSKMVETVGLPSNSVRSASRRQHRILIAEDDITLLHLNADMLMGLGYEVDVAEDGEAAWQALNAGNYHLLITDNNMPKVTGIELLQRLRGARMEVPVVLVSGQMPTAELERHPQLNIEATLLKPYTIEQFLGTVEEVLSRPQGAEIRQRGSETGEAIPQPSV